MMLKKIISIASLTALAACGSEKNGEATIGTAFRGLAKTGLAKVIPKKAKNTKKSQQTLNRQMISESKNKLVLGQLDRLGVVNLFEKTAQNGNNATYRSSSALSITLDNGIIVATRGIALDLMSQSSELSARQMFSSHAAQGPYKRKHRYLTTDSKLVTVSYICESSFSGAETIEIIGKKYNTRKFVENCKHPAFSFQNEYWVGANARDVWKSKQLTHPELGTITLQKLN